MKKGRLFSILTTLVLFASILTQTWKPLEVGAASSTPTLTVEKSDSVGTFYGLKTIKLEGTPGYFSDARFYDTNSARFSIYKDGNLIETKDYKYKYSAMSDSITHKFFPSEYGTYRVTFCHLTWNSTASAWTEDYFKYANFEVVNPKKASKTTPKFTIACEPYSVNISGLDATATTKIYRATSEKGKYSLIKTVKSSTYTDTNVDAKTYYYKIKAKISSGKKTYTTKASKAVAAYLSAPSAPVVKSVSYADGKLTIKWKKNKDYDSSVIFVVRICDKSNVQVDDRWAGNYIGTFYNTNEAETSVYNYGEGDTKYIYVWAYRDENSDMRSISKGYKYKIPNYRDTNED